MFIFLQSTQKDGFLIPAMTREKKFPAYLGGDQLVLRLHILGH
jgi:hypothetical protein